MAVVGDEVAEVARWAEGIERVHECIGRRFRRPEPRRRALDYLRGLLSPVERKNGWQLAEQAGDATPDGVQRLLSTCRWDADLVRDDLRDYVMEHLGDADGVLVVDETGFLKKGNKSVGVQRQYSGTAGRVENCQIGVFLAYASAKGRALPDRELYLPQVWSEDRERRREAGVPEDVGFQTKPRLARRMLERALESEVPFGWVAGDEVYGNDRNLRLWLEHQGIPHVLAIRSNEKLWAGTEKGPLQVRADRLASQVGATDWTRCSAGDGAKGPRIYDWATVDIRPLKEPGRGYWLLARRSVSKPGELAYYVCFGPAETALEELVKVAGTRWAIEECFEEAKGQVGLDQYEVRPWEGWYRHITLAMLAHAYLAVIRHQVSAQGCSRERGGCPGLDERLIPMTVPEVRRLLTRLVWTANHPAELVLSWSLWRRHHQAQARRCHYQRRLSLLNSIVQL